MDRIRIGWGRREISIDEPVNIAGQFHIRVSEGILDPLYATALCVDGGAGQDAVIFLSADVATVYEGTLQPIADTARALDPTVPAHAIVYNATHTHTAPAVGGEMEVSPDGRPMFSGDRYKEFFIRMCAEAVVEAWQNRSEGGVGYGYGYAFVAFSRRTVYFKEMEQLQPRSISAPNGYVQMYGQCNHSLFSGFEAGADHFLNVLFTFDKENKLTGMIANVPCPSQVTEMYHKLSSDYWNEVRELVAKEFGPDVYVLTQCAAAGDLTPRGRYYMGAQERRMRLKYDMGYDRSQTGDPRSEAYITRCMAERKDIAERIVAGVKEVYDWASKEIFTELPVQHCYEIMALERRKITDEEVAWCKENLEILEQQKAEIEKLSGEAYSNAVTIHAKNVERNQRLLNRAEDVKVNPTLDMGAHVVRIGDVAFATIRFELFQDFMHRLQARSPFLQTFVVQLAGAEGGNYLATHRAAEGKGYSASLFCNMVSADGGQQWVENCLRIMEDMK